MRCFLLTWYGITDFRAALGFEESGGPVLGALATREYTHVLILAYTDPTKAEPDSEQVQAYGPRRVAARKATDSTLSRQEQMATVDALANTRKGHALFRDWLHGEVSRLGLGVSIRIVDKELDSLSDAKGAYDAASEALDVVLATEGDKEVTLYLSPGTPVMAFTWAFVSLMNPELKLRVIASPDYRRQPEEIRLPYEILVPSSRKRQTVVPGGRGEFDTVFHLFGEQRLPGLLGILQFPSQRHVFVTSPKYPANCMRPFMPAGVDFSELRVNPFDPMSAMVEILRAVAAMPAGARIGFNLTGGTKLMFAGAQAACRKIGGVPFYFEARDHTMVFLDDFATMDVRGVDDVERFVELAGFSVSRRGFWNDEPIRERRREFTRILWRQRNRIASLYKDLSGLVGNEPGQREFRIEKGALSASLDRNDQACLRIGSAEYLVDRCPDFAAYLCGGWLEEYVHILMEPLVRAGRIQDLRIGLELAWAPRTQESVQFAAQEFDLVFTDGKRLFIIECKAGRVRNEDVYKLENSIRKYGGVEARGILVAAFPPPEAPLRRLRSGKNLSHCAGRGVPEHLAQEISAMTSLSDGGPE